MDRENKYPSRDKCATHQIVDPDVAYSTCISDGYQKWHDDSQFELQEGKHKP